MSRAGYMLLRVMTRTMALTMLLVLSVHAADSKPNALLVLERPVLEVAGTPGENKFLSIPRAALIERNGIPGVFVLEDNEARFRMVRPGETRAGKVKILSGLFGGETLVMGELETVHDGSPIKISTGK